jgi:signal peptidase I
MEIVTAPYQPVRSGWSRALLVGCVLAPVTLLALLPMGLGLERFVITGDRMAPTLERGAVVLERDVPVTDLRVGDVITFDRPGTGRHGEDPVTSRIVSLADGQARTRGDGLSGMDPWQLPLDQPTQARMVFAVPYVGYVYLALVHPGGWTVPLAFLLGLVGLALAAVQGHRRPVRRP